MKKTGIMLAFAQIACVLMTSSCCGKWFDRYDDYDEKIEYAIPVEEPEDSKIRIIKTEYKTIKPGKGLTKEQKALMKSASIDDSEIDEVFKTPGLTGAKPVDGSDEIGKAKKSVGGGKTKTTIKGGHAKVMGSLSMDVIRKVIRQHLAEVKFCYEKELAKKPDLAGKVVVQFIISAKGKVKSATIKSSTMNSAGFESCLVKKIKRWVFPQPKGGGIVIVTYPFFMQPSGTENNGG